MLTPGDLTNFALELGRQLPPTPESAAPGPHERFFGGDKDREARIWTALETGLADPQAWPGCVPPDLCPDLRIRLGFAAEVFQQMADENPTFPIPQEMVPRLLQSAVLEVWQTKGLQWATAEFGPRR